jgi:uncharacterized protein (TIGR02391 family)
MKGKEAIIDMWRSGYFEQYRLRKEVEKYLLKEYGITHSNISMILGRCKFLRKKEKGWIQKTRYAKTYREGSGQLDYFELLQIHPQIAKVSKKLFQDRHFAPAIFEAFKKVNNLVKSKSNRKDLDGKSLMQTVFSPNNPTLCFNELSTQSEKDEQEGFMYLFTGAILGVRNPKAHENIVQRDVHRTIEYLVLASLLCKRLDEAEVRKNNKNIK